MMTTPTGQGSEIAFFDLETTMPGELGEGDRVAILEFGAILFCPEKLVELFAYSTLVRPSRISSLSSLNRSNGITYDAIVSAPTFYEIADTVYQLLDGKIWAGHNIQEFDCVKITEAFSEIGENPPRPKGIIDTLPLLRDIFGTRAGNMKMANLATYFGLGRQKHRSLEDIRMNLEILKCCAVVSILSDPKYSKNYEGFIEPDDVSISSIIVSFSPFGRGERMELLHKDIPLQLSCDGLRVQFGIEPKYFDNAGRPRLNFVVEASPTLCRVLHACDDIVSKESDSNSDWNPVVTRRTGSAPGVRLHIPPAKNGDVGPYATEIYLKDPSGAIQKLKFGRFDAEELQPWFRPGTLVAANFSLEPYDYMDSAGIRLVAKKLTVDEE